MSTLSSRASPSSRLRTGPRAGHAAFALGALLAFGGLGAMAWRATRATEPAAAPEIVGRDWDGDTYRLTSDQGRVRLLFFGYTHCPDICPGSFARARRLAGELTPAQAAELSVVFVSVDPERDDPTTLANYVAAFDTRFHGLSLATNELEPVLRSYGAVAQKRGAAEGGFYTVDHTSSFFLIDRAGRLRTSLPFDGEFATLLEEVRALLAEPPLSTEKAEPDPEVAPAAPGEDSCCSLAQAAAEPESGPVAVLGELAVHAPRMGPSRGEVAAVYLTLENRGERAERLLAVRAPAARSELHESVHEGDTVRMLARPEGFALPAGGRLELAPGGKHVMLFELAGPLAVGDTLELVLVFQDAGALTLAVPVEERR